MKYVNLMSNFTHFASFKVLTQQKQIECFYVKVLLM